MDDHTTRRRYLATGAAAAASLLPGCGFLFGGSDRTPTPTDSPTATPPPDADNDGVPDVDDDFPVNPRYREEVLSVEEEIELPPGEYQDYSFQVEKETKLRYGFEVKSGPNVDVLLFTGGEFEGYEAGEDASHMGSESTLDSSGSQSGTSLSAGGYHIVIDNTDAGKATPGGSTAVVTVDILVAR